MSFSWPNYLVLAKDLAGWSVSEPVNEEAKLRSAISRAYYASFHVIKGYLEEKGEIDTLPTGRSQHQGIIIHLKNSSERDRKKLGHNLNRLLSDRRRADYYSSFHNIKNQTNSAIKTAERIFKSIESL